MYLTIRSAKAVSVSRAIAAPVAMAIGGVLVLRGWSRPWGSIFRMSMATTRETKLPIRYLENVVWPGMATAIRLLAALMIMIGVCWLILSILRASPGLLRMAEITAFLTALVLLVVLTAVGSSLRDLKIEQGLYVMVAGAALAAVAASLALFSRIGKGKQRDGSIRGNVSVIRLSIASFVAVVGGSLVLAGRSRPWASVFYWSSAPGPQGEVRTKSWEYLTSFSMQADILTLGSLLILLAGCCWLLSLWRSSSGPLSVAQFLTLMTAVTLAGSVMAAARRFSNFRIEEGVYVMAAGAALAALASLGAILLQLASKGKNPLAPP